ncbi:hypothetical protein HJG54_31935 [Leptolyngbya sp. NK1-12]|uniref:Uncharacterized protein n=1 Tax=Leptolyngbya sp. NK1-12 TaxID=2547451 RepID=A0AA96WLX1_9CYAN|nr:hypothetical protein [Leptolyngbya sp. NK1-12]MBF2046904.1 hypothetical protein [Elainella sp. C42_A2020_010]WNZ27490.1 hypothetical protein HJG54_31935 [Leptolyngbya sp. NK1-12]
MKRTVKQAMLAGLSVLALSSAFALPSAAIEQPLAQSLEQKAQAIINKQVDPTDEQGYQQLLNELNQMFEQERQAMMAEINERMDRMHDEMVRILNERFREAREQRLNR